MLVVAIEGRVSSKMSRATVYMVRIAIDAMGIVLLLIVPVQDRTVMVMLCDMRA